MNSLKRVAFEAVPRATQGCQVGMQRCCSGAESSTVLPYLHQQHCRERQQEIHSQAPTSTRNCKAHADAGLHSQL